MAATVSAWSKPGAWALDSEENEAELLQQQHHNNHNDDDASLTGKPLADFPSLAVAAATKPKKKKGQTFSLAEFAAVKTAPSEPIVLPTGPRQRSSEELEQDRSRIGGGFRSYGLDRQNRNSSGGSGDESSNSRWGSSRVSDEPRRNGGFRDSNRELAPSRADEIDNWAAAKKSTVGNGFERRERERSGFFDSPSRADDSDSWVSTKSFVPSEGRRSSSNGGSGGGGFERERRVGFGSSGGADSDNWNKKKGGSEKTESGSGGRPRLVLQPRTAPVNNESNEGGNGAGNVVKPKGANPFGEARPREEVLAEKGQDWKKIDEQLESVKIKEAAEKKESFGKRGFGSGNGRASLPEGRTERSWRKADESETKTESEDGGSESAEKVEDEHVEEKN